MTEADPSGTTPPAALLRALTDQPLVGVYLIQDGRFRFANDKLAATLGCLRP